ncbi:MAG: hypothetical protein M1830_003444 [Pleopsidium flavum]|nr:MAG: hypothetical protein M1830_003444 [Pleopsidium flavum]
MENVREEVKTVLETQRPEVTARFPFQKLPPELRNRIYNMHLIQPERKTRLRQALFQTHVAEEIYLKMANPGAGIFYFYNELSLDNSMNLRNFLTSIGPKRRSFARDLTFNFRGFGSPAAFKLLASCDRLTKLHIQASYDTLSGARSSECGTIQYLLKSPGTRHLLKIRGLETVEFSYHHVKEEPKKGFEKTVRAALLQPKKPVKGGKRGEKGEGISNSGKVITERHRAGKGE